MLEWVKENVAFLTLAITIVGGGFALLQWKKQIDIKRTEFAYQIMEKLRNNKEIAQTCYMIEYGEFRYNDEFHNNHALEHKIDELLSVLNYVCYLLRNRAIGKRDFSIFKYETVWILKSKEIQAYLWNLYHWSQRNKTPCSFQFLIDWGLQNNLFPPNFTSKECQTFIRRKHLNF